MAVDANTYGTVARVEAMVGDLVADRTFADGGSPTIPSLTEVELFLDDVASEINVELDYMNYTVPVSASNFPAAHAFLAAANSAGAAAKVLGMLPAESYVDPENEESAAGRKQFLDRQLWLAIKRIREGRFRADMRQSRLADFRIGSRLDDDSYTKLPLFTRDKFNYPNTTPIVES